MPTGPRALSPTVCPPPWLQVALGFGNFLPAFITLGALPCNSVIGVSVTSSGGSTHADVVQVHEVRNASAAPHAAPWRRSANRPIR